MRKKPKASVNKAKNVETKISEKDLLAKYGALGLEYETHIARLKNTEQKMQQVKQQLVKLIKRKKGN